MLKIVHFSGAHSSVFFSTEMDLMFHQIWKDKLKELHIDGNNQDSHSHGKI